MSKNPIFFGILASGAVTAAALGSMGSSTTSNATAHVRGPEGAINISGANRLSGVPLQGSGARMVLQKGTAGAVSNELYSSNWSGIGGVSNPGVIKGAEGEWNVPAAKATLPAKYAASWVGVDGMLNGNLIQTGTAENSSGLRYYAWVEILPSAESILVRPNGSPAPVRPKDKIIGIVAKSSGTIWTVFLEDKTQNWYFKQNFYYYGPGDSAEWIQEAPTVNGQQAMISNFGSVNFSHTGVYLNDGAGKAWYSTAMGAKDKIVLEQNGVEAVPSTPSPLGGSANGQSFTDTYKVTG